MCATKVRIQHRPPKEQVGTRVHIWGTLSVDGTLFRLTGRCFGSLLPLSRRVSYRRTVPSDELDVRLRQNKGRRLWPNLRQLLEVIIDRQLTEADLVRLEETEALKQSYYERLRRGEGVVRFSWTPTQVQGVWLTVEQIRVRNADLDVVLLHEHDKFVGAVRVKVHEALSDPRRIWGAVGIDLCLMTAQAKDGFCLEFSHLSSGDLYELSTWGSFSGLPGNDSFVRQLAAAIPEVKLLLDEHLKDNRELLPYVFLGSYVWPWFEAQFNSGTTQGLRACRQYIDMLEAELARDDEETANLIGVEFLEWLLDGQGRESIRAILPQRLTKELERMDNWGIS